MKSQARQTSNLATTGEESGPRSTQDIANHEHPMSIADLTFDHQIAIWSLRMFLQGHKAIETVRTEFNNALPPAAGRIAHTAVERIIGTLRRYGKRNIRLSCMCNALLTRDEISILVLLIASRGDDYSEMTRRAGDLVVENGVHMLVDSVAIFLSALEARHADVPEQLPLCIADGTVH